MSKVHMIRDDLGPYGPYSAYCGRSGDIELAFDVRSVTCQQCKRSMRVDWCVTWGKLLVAWEPEDVCACDAREVES